METKPNTHEPCDWNANVDGDDWHVFQCWRSAGVPVWYVAETVRNGTRIERTFSPSEIAPPPVMHAPGPWIVIGESHGKFYAPSLCGTWNQVQHECARIAEETAGNWGTVVIHIPLAIMSADLLVALQGLLTCHCGPDVLPGECCEHVKAAEAALAKAEGGK